jgi:hypothetical protein
MSRRPVSLDAGRDTGNILHPSVFRFRIESGLKVRMAKRHHIDDILRDWPYDPQSVSVRIVKAADRREVIQMRVEMGLLQLETDGRPDGTRPRGYETYYDYVQSLALTDPDYELDEDECAEVDREFVQFYHRRICWLAMRQYKRAVADADHTLGLMDFCRKHSSEEQWTMSHEQYRPFVLFHRTQAAALAELDSAVMEEAELAMSDAENGNEVAELEDQNGAEGAINVINEGLDRLREVFVQYGVEEHFDEDDLVTRLIELREELREKHALGRTLREQLDDAVAAEQYERAARIRDELSRRGDGLH